MKKSILIGALAVLMLVAFTACENSAPTAPLYGKDIQGVSVVSAPEYVVYDSELKTAIHEFKDDVLNPADVKLRVTYNDDSYDEYTGSELGMTSGTLVAGSNTRTVKIGPAEFNVVINAYEAESVIFNVSNATTKTVAVGDEVSLEGIKVEAIYDGSKTKTLAMPEDAELDFAVLSYFADPETAQQTKSVTISAETFEKAKKNASAPDWFDLIEVEGSWTISVVEAQPVTITATISNPTEVFSRGTKSTIQGANLDFTITVAYSDDTPSETFKKSEASTKGWTVAFENWKEDAALFSENQLTATLIVSVTKTGTTLTDTYDLQLTATTDYPIAIKADLDTAQGAKPKTFKADELIDSDDFKFEVTAWASNVTPSTLVTETNNPNILSKNDFSADPERIKLGQEDTGDGESYPISFTSAKYAKAKITSVDVQIVNNPTA